VADASFDLEIVDLTHRRVPESSWQGAPVHDAAAPAQWIKEWKGDGLSHDLESNFYATGGGEAVRSGVLRSTDSRDHLATKWVPLPGATSRNVVLEVGMPPFAKDYGSGRLTLQNQNYDTLFDSGTLDALTSRVQIPLKPGSLAVRVIFVPNDDHIVVPAVSVRIGITP
jgi:hypothetical protein